MHEVRDIGRWLVLFMGLVSFHAAGKVLVSKQWLKHIVRAVIELSSRFRRSLLLIWSAPGADVVRRSASACPHSISSMGAFRASFGALIY